LPNFHIKYDLLAASWYNFLERYALKSVLIFLVFLISSIPCHPQAGRAQSSPNRQAQRPTPKPKLPAFSSNQAVAEFISQMVAKHEFEADWVTKQFSNIAPNERVLNLMLQSAPSQTQTQHVVRSWKTYRGQFLTKSRIEDGVAFWKKNAEILARAYEQYGVPPEVIVAIIGVETLYGQRTGTYCVLEALASLAFHDTRRPDFFLAELEQFFLLTKENGIDLLKPVGSYAGAIGIPQFMPSSWRKFGVDFDGDGVVDLEKSVADSIGSVANYLNAHGWQKDQPIAHKVIIEGRPKDAWLNAGMQPSLSVSELATQGVKVAPISPEMATLISLPTPGQQTEYWLGYQNYYAITRYNRSTFYSMSVFQLAEEIRAKFTIQ